MMILIRRILFYVFCLIYIVFCPLTILYALGIIFKPGSQTLLKTGIIYLSTVPSGANVYINRALFPEKTPTIIRNLPPGQYTIRLTLEHHHPWTKELKVEEERATTAENILFIPKSWKPVSIAEDQFNRLIALPQVPFLLLYDKPFLKDLRIYKWNAGLRQEIMSNVTLAKEPKSFGSLFEADNHGKIIEIYQTAGSPWFVIKAVVNNKTRYIVTNPDDPSAAKATDITDLIFEEPDHIIWERGQDQSLFLVKGKNVSRIDIAAKAVFPNILQDVHGAGAIAGKLYYIDGQGNVHRADINGRFEETLLFGAQFPENPFAVSSYWQITELAPNIIVFLDKTGRLIWNEEPYILIKEDVKGFQFDTRHSRLLVWTDKQLGFIDFSIDADQEPASYHPPITWLVEGRTIDQAFWVNDGAQVLYRENNRVFLTERETFGQPEFYELLRVQKNTDIAYSDEVGQMFYIDTEKGTLNSIELLPIGFSFPIP